MAWKNVAPKTHGEIERKKNIALISHRINSLAATSLII